MKRSLIIACGGIGSRMLSGQPKQFMKINGKPVLHWTVQKLAGFGFEEVAITYPEGFEDETKNAAKGIRNVIFVQGGSRRQDTVKNAVLKIKKAEIVYIHDGVRPVIERAMIERLETASAEHAAVIPVIAIPETVKEDPGDGLPLATVPRDNLRLAQTPQVFRLKDYLDVMLKVSFGRDYTDDAQMFETLKKPVATVEGSRYNIKITYEDDLRVAEKFMELLR